MSCIDCGAPNGKKYLRCRSCGLKESHRKNTGTTRWSFASGIPRPVTKCEICGIKISKYATHCISCSVKGRVASEQTKQRMSIAQTGLKRSEQAKINIGNGQRGKIISPEQREKLRIAGLGKSKNKGIPLTEEHKKNLSVAQLKSYREGRRLGGKIPWTKYRGQWYRSGYEAKYARWLDLWGIGFKYEPRRFHLKNTTYTPDFYLPKTDEYVEIKGYFTAEIYFKLLKFVKKYSEIKWRVLFWNDLVEIGALQK